jgi:hypothetical protein
MVQLLAGDADLRSGLITLHRGIYKLTEEKLRLDQQALEEQMAEHERANAPPQKVLHSVII